MAGVHVPPERIILSNIAGSTSLACWIVLLLPQLIEQWKVESSEGISIGFLVIWTLGDLTNLIGAIWAKLLPEVILLACWYCCADVLLLTSYGYYKHKTYRRSLRRLHHERRRPSRETAECSDSTEPLLNRRNSAFKHKAGSRTHHRRDSLSSIIENSNNENAFTTIVLPVILVLGAGTLGYFISHKSLREGQQKEPDNELVDEPMSMGPQILGYASALLYLSARIPQIVQNHTRKSVYGLSLLFFILSTLGNLSYAAQILIYRNDYEYIKLNLSWLLGSLGTVVEDAIIFVQFYIYKNPDEDRAISQQVDSAVAE